MVYKLRCLEKQLSFLNNGYLVISIQAKGLKLTFEFIITLNRLI